MGKEWRMRTVWPRLTTGLAAGLVAAGLLLSGCGGDSPEPKPLPKDSKSSPSASPSATPPEMPAAAKKKTKAGAIAFVRHYVERHQLRGSIEWRDDRTRAAESRRVQVLQVGPRRTSTRLYSSGGSIEGGAWSADQVIGSDPGGSGRTCCEPRR